MGFGWGDDALFGFELDVEAVLDALLDVLDEFEELLSGGRSHFFDESTVFG